MKAETGPLEAARGTLFVVATPIGNLGDLSPRALDTLRAVSLVAAEDTRVLARLLARHDLRPSTTSYHARNASARGPAILARLRGGADVALVTDAGTPVVSDPGEALVAAWHAEGGRVVPIPGPSAVMPPRWRPPASPVHAGPSRVSCPGRGASAGSGSRQSRPTSGAASCSRRPVRLAATIDELGRMCGLDRPAAICRELTKLHEQVVVGIARIARARHRRGPHPRPWRGRRRGRLVAVGRRQPGGR